MLLLNTDVYFDPDERCLTKMVAFMDSHPACGIAGCRVYHEDGSYAYPARRFQTLPIVLSRRLGLGRLLPGALEGYLYQERAIGDAWECDWVSGASCSFAARRSKRSACSTSGFSSISKTWTCVCAWRRAGSAPMFNGATYCYHVERRSSKNLLSIDAWKHARSYLRWLGKWGFSPAAEPALPRPAQRRRAA